MMEDRKSYDKKNKYQVEKDCLIMKGNTSLEKKDAFVMGESERLLYSERRHDLKDG